MQDNVYPTVLNELCDTIETIQEKLRHTISYSIKAKCSSGDYSKSEDRITLKEINEGKVVYFCEEHRCSHSTDDIRNSWLKPSVSINFVSSNSGELNVRLYVVLQ